MRIALPKGRLLRPLLTLFERRGIHFGFLGDRDYRPKSNLANLDAKLIKARDVPQMVAIGNFPLGFTCLDVVEEGGYAQLEVRARLGVSKVRIVAAVHQSNPRVLERPPARPLVVATEYPNLAGRWLMSKGLAHIAVGGTGSIEAYPPEDADLIVDVVETGASLKANGLIEVETLMHSETCAVVNRDAPDEPDVREFLRRLTEKED
jgi:ATP phosphoribosyltransferase